MSRSGRPRANAAGAARSRPSERAQGARRRHGHNVLVHSPKRGRQQVALVIALACAAALPAAAQDAARDLHAYWHDRCQSCHADAGPFARSTLRVVNGQLQGRHHRDDLPTFLSQHYVADELVQPIIAMLAAQVGAAPRFLEQCGGCHGKAAEFARQSLVREQGVLKGRQSGRPVAMLLRGHGELADGDVPAMVNTLERVHAEVAGGTR